MSARPDTWMPMYWGDYARDTGNLNNAGHGAYMMLIKHYWCTGSPLSDDDDELWRIACCDSKKDWMKIKRKILRFFVVESGILRHNRVDREIAKTIAISTTKAEAGKKGAEKRWQKDDTKIAPAIEVPTVCQWQNDAPSQPPSPSKKDSGSLRSPAPDARVELWAVGLPAFQAMTGMHGTKGRSALGKLVKDARDDCALVMAVLNEAGEQHPIDPFPWLRQAIQSRVGGREGVAEQIAREVGFTVADFFDQESDLRNGKRQTRDGSLLAHDVEARDPPDF